MSKREKSYRFRPLQYETCSICGFEVRRRGPVPWIHFDSGYFKGLREGRITEHEPHVNSNA